MIDQDVRVHDCECVALCISVCEAPRHLVEISCYNKPRFYIHCISKDVCLAEVE